MFGVGGEPGILKCFAHQGEVGQEHQPFRFVIGHCDGRRAGKVARHAECRYPGSDAGVVAARRRVVLLVAGDKAGHWTHWYRDAIKLAEDRYARFLATPPEEIR